MNFKNINFLGCSFLGLIFCFGQELAVEDLVSRENAENVIENYLIDNVVNKNYILFSISEKYFLILVEEISSYKEYYLSIKNENVEIKKTNFSKPNELFASMFEKKSYKSDFITFDSPFFSKGMHTAMGSVTYFVMKDTEGVRYGESRLCVFIDPNPINLDAYYYLTTRITEY